MRKDVGLRDLDKTVVYRRGRLKERVKIIDVAVLLTAFVLAAVVFTVATSLAVKRAVGVISWYHFRGRHKDAFMRLHFLARFAPVLRARVARFVGIRANEGMELAFQGAKPQRAIKGPLVVAVVAVPAFGKDILKYLLLRSDRALRQAVFRFRHCLGVVLVAFLFEARNVVPGVKVGEVRPNRASDAAT